jgi:signal transduction histidine kinase
MGKPVIIGHASRADVAVDVTASGLALTVADNGVGMAAGEQGKRSGLHNIDERAARLGGTAELETPPGGTWCAGKSLSQTGRFLCELP